MSLLLNAIFFNVWLIKRDKWRRRGKHQPYKSRGSCFSPRRGGLQKWGRGATMADSFCVCTFVIDQTQQLWNYILLEKCQETRNSQNKDSKKINPALTPCQLKISSFSQKKMFQMHNNFNELWLHPLLRTITQFPLAQEPLTCKNNETSSHSHLKKSNLDGYFKSQGKVKCSEQKGLIIITFVTSWRESTAGASDAVKEMFAGVAPAQSVLTLTVLWRNFGTGPEEAGKGHISSSVWAACQWA